MKTQLRVRKQTLIEFLVCATILSPLMGDSQRPAKPLSIAVARQAVNAALPPIHPDDWQSFNTTLRQRSRRFSGQVGYVIKDLRSGEVVETNADRVFLSASLIKLPILVAAFQ